MQRRRRTAVIGGFIGLGALVVAAMVALVVIQRSRTESKRRPRSRGGAERRRETRSDHAEKPPRVNGQLVEKKKEAEDSLHEMQEKEPSAKPR